MNKKHFLWRLFAVAFAAVLTFGLGACSDDDTDEGDFQLYYPEVTNFGPSMSYVSGNPSYVGGTPSAFGKGRASRTSSQRSPRVKVSS